MLDMSINDRIIFQKGDQAKFILACKVKLDFSWVNIARKLEISTRTVRDWSKENNRMSYVMALKLSKIAKTPLPRKIRILKWKDHMRMIGKIGGDIQYDKNGSIGNEKNRKQAWLRWWKEKGVNMNNPIFIRKKIKIPEQTVQLAEFVGIMIGDGSINDYTVKITLDSFSDKDYVVYVVKLIIKLFDIVPLVRKHNKFRALDVIIQSRNLVEFCVGIGLKKGNKIKQNADIPFWIKDNKQFSIACVRGLVDTDGCLFKHTYVVNKKIYNYNKIAFTNKCPLVLRSMYEILIKLGFHVRITKDGNDVRIDRQEEVSKYLSIIGTSNPKFKTRII